MIGEMDMVFETAIPSRDGMIGAEPREERAPVGSFV